ncbi:MAG TPA: DUF2225 domain-containing protein [Planctomycetota bacterium]|nr:DUF2225 domain-containing protein [Planctomycetota bacterium]
MRYARCLALALAASAMCVPGFAATKVEMREFTCPVDDTTFTARALVETDAFGGTDSDFCPWPKGSSGLPYGVQVCPKCFYGTRNDYFNQKLPGDIKEKLKTALEKWRTDHPKVTKVEDLTPGQRWELTAVCGMVKHNHPPVMGELWQRAAWATRHHALQGVHLAFGDPMSAFEMIDGMALDLKAERNKTKALEQTFQLVMACHRAGDAKRRDEFIKVLEGKNPDAESTARLERLKQAFADEDVYLQRIIAAWNEALEKDLVKPEHQHVLLYVIADSTRRLGRTEEAVKLYNKVKESGKIRPDIQKMCDFMINWLSPE